jgi:hypothetical protein
MALNHSSEIQISNQDNNNVNKIVSPGKKNINKISII